MKKYMIILAALLTGMACSEYPIDEDGLLITDRSECYVSSFELLGSDEQSVRSREAIVDTVAQTIDVEVFYGTDLTGLYPQFSLATDAKLDPKINGKVDFSDLDNPKQYTVISGNRKVRKTYTIYISVQQK
jgi:hypothetical protein